MRRLSLLALTISAFGLTCFSQTQHERMSIEGTISRLSEHLGVFAPSFEDSTMAISLRKDLLGYIDTLQNMRRDGMIRDHESYYLWMAKLYTLAYHILEPQSLERSIQYFESALEVNPDSPAARIGLAANLSQLWDPGDSSSFKYLNRSYSLLFNVYREGVDSLNPALYWNLYWCGLLFHSHALCFDVQTKWIMYCSTGQDSADNYGWPPLPEDSALSFRTLGSDIVYENRVARFGVRYPSYFTLYREVSSWHHGSVQSFMVETPLTHRTNDVAIRNSISIIAIPSKGTSIDQLFARHLEQTSHHIDSVRTSVPPVVRSYYTSSRDKMPDRYKGVWSYLTHGDYIMQIGYMATELTFDTNMPYFLEFEKSLVFF